LKEKLARQDILVLPRYTHYGTKHGNRMIMLCSIKV